MLYLDKVFVVNIKLVFNNCMCDYVRLFCGVYDKDFV